MTIAVLGRLDIVNHALRAIGSTPITALTNPAKTDDEKKAVATMDEWIRKAQTARDWWFNFTPNAELTLTGGFLYLPTTPQTYAVRWADQRATPSIAIYYDPNDLYKPKVKNMTDNTLVWTSSQKFALTFVLDLEETPESFREYVMAETSYEFYRDRATSMERLGPLKWERDSAWGRLIDEDSYMEKRGHLDARPLMRSIPYPRGMVIPFS